MPSPSFFWEVSGQIYALCSLRTREGGQINSLYNICIVFKIADIQDETWVFCNVLYKMLIALVVTFELVWDCGYLVIMS